MPLSQQTEIVVFVCLNYEPKMINVLLCEWFSSFKENFDKFIALIDDFFSKISMEPLFFF